MPESDKPPHGAGVPVPDRRGFMRAALGATALAGATVAQAAPLRGKDIKTWAHDTDVLVMGSGIGGICAAIEARQQGARVTVLEKYHVLGGSSAMSGGVCYLGGGTPLQKALGFEDSVQAMRDFMVAASGAYAPVAKIELYCEGSLAHYDWLVAQGVQYAHRFSAEKELSHGAASLYYCGSEKNRPFRDLARPAPRGHVPPAQNQTGGRSLMQTLIAQAKRLDVNIVPEVDVQRLVLAQDGAVLGVQAVYAGQTVQWRARRGVVLAAGGFVHNEAMMQQFAPVLNRCRGKWAPAGHQGQGILMGMAAGARPMLMDHGFAVLPMYPPEEVLKGIVVNASGQRCISEDSYYGVIGDEMLFHQKGRGFLIVDADCDYAAPDYRLVQAAKADTVAGLEQSLGLPAGILQRTVEFYNQHAAQGQDPLFGKAAQYLAPLRRGPFVAYDLSVERAFYTTQTFGGLETSVDGEVIHAWGQPIPGLYAVGRCSAGLPVSPYYASGLSLGDGSFFGRRAGAHAALRKV